MLFPCIVFAEETEQLETTDEGAIQSSIIKDLKIEATDVDRCKLTWHTDAEKVKIHYTCSDVDKTATSSSGSYDEYNIPFGQTAAFTLTTDDQHEPVSLSCNPSDEFTPTEIQNNETKTFSKNHSDVQYYCSDWKICTKNGEYVSKSYFSLESPEIKKPGYYNVKISFKGKYKDYKPLTAELKVIPSKPSVGYNPKNPHLDYIQVSVICWNGGDNITAELSSSQDFTTPVKKTYKVNSEPIEIKFTNLKQNSTYYIRIRLKDENIYSEYSTITMYTAKKLPAYSPSQKDVKNIISKMKNNKTFTYTLNGRYNAGECYDFLDKLDVDFAQYSNRYYRDTSFDDGVIKITYTLKNSAQVKKCQKSTSVINSIVKKAKKKKGTKAKIKYVNSKLCSLCRYDYDTYKRTKKYNQLAYTAYGCLVRHKAVCQGYSEAFHLIMVQLGIPDKYQQGKNHIWNKVKVGNTWYHVDVTWNDTCGKKTKYLLKKSHK